MCELNIRMFGIEIRKQGKYSYGHGIERSENNRQQNDDKTRFKARRAVR